MVSRRAFLRNVSVSLVLAPLAAQAQHARKVARVGVLATALDSSQLDAFRRGLRELDWIEGGNLVLEIRSAEGRSANLEALAAVLVKLKVDVIFATDVAAAHAARRATPATPVVGASLGDAVAQGFAVSFARPGGNVTGLSLQSEELTGKYFELLKEMLPALSRVAILQHSRPAGVSMKDFESAARALGLTPLPIGIRTARDFGEAFHTAVRGHAQALMLASGPLFAQHGRELAALALANRLPSIGFENDFAAGGGLLNYGPRVADNYHRAATYVHRVLNGARPGELPIERPTRFYLAVNLHTAKALSLTIPPSLLLRADQVID